MPEWIEDLRPRLARLRLDPARESEIVEELSQHLDERFRELRGAGASEADARRGAVEELCGPDALAEHMRSLRQAHAPHRVVPGAPGTSVLADLRQDLRYSMRMVRSQRAFAATVILTVALGIGVNSAMFALVDAALLRPLPFPGADRLVMIWERIDASPRERVSPPNLLDWNERNRTFERIAAFIPGVGSMVMAGADGTSETVPRQWVTAGFFDVLGVQPVAGRTFLPSDANRMANVVVLSEAFWRARFAADPGVIGQDIRLDGEPFTVLGVVPDSFKFAGRTSVWAMIALARRPELRGVHVLYAIGRMKPDVAIEAASADLDAIATGLAAEFPATNQGRGVSLEPMHDALIGTEVRLTSLLFLGVVGFVLVICCANLASLFLARATLRTREFAIRSALGAGRHRVIRQLVTESLVLAVLGGLLGAAVGLAILRVAPSLVPEGVLPDAVVLQFDARVAGFCGVTALLVGLLFGLAPAWRAARGAPARAMTSESRTVTTGGGRVRQALVGGQVAAAVLLLFCAGLLLRTLAAVEAVDRGYRANEVLTMIVDPLGSRYPTDAALLQFFDAVEQEVRSVAGVRSVAWATTLPLGESTEGSASFEVVGDPLPDRDVLQTANHQTVSTGYFGTVDLSIVAGRAFSDLDTSGTGRVCIVNEAFARKHFQGRSPIGARLTIRPAGFTQAPAITREIVGVARQVKGRPDEIDDLLQIYVPIAQNPVNDIYLAVRPSSGSAASLASGVRAAIARVDRDQLVSVRDVTTLEDIAWSAGARHRFRAILVGTFAALALLLTMVGVCGILAYAVQQRVRDFGVRRALGATTVNVLRLAVGSSVGIVASGAAVGLVLAAAIGRLLTAVLFGVRPLDPMTLCAVALVLLAATALSMAGPAWRAVRIEPATALRGE